MTATVCKKCAVVINLTKWRSMWAITEYHRLLYTFTSVLFIKEVSLGQIHHNADHDESVTVLKMNEFHALM